MSIQLMKSRMRYGSLCALVVAVAAAVSPVVAASVSASDTFGPVTILKNQEYALCAGALAFVLDGVAYAKCTMMHGTSISATLSYPAVTLPGQPGNVIDAPGNVETINNLGNKQNSYMVSTFSPPTSPSKYGVYTCQAGSAGSYAQCDGGICFRSTSGTTFPGVGAVAKGQIVCSCPITTPGSTAQLNYLQAGPLPCLKGAEYKQLCNAPVKNGSTLYIGAPAPTFTYMTQLLNGNTGNLTFCPAPAN